MSRRKFIFRSLQSALLLSPIFELRNLAAQTGPKKVIPFFFVDGGSPYYRGEDFFPNAGSGGNFNLPTVLSGFRNLKKDMVILDGVDMRNMRDDSKGNWHVSSVGKVLTAKAVIKTGDAEKAYHGGPSIDYLISQQLQTRAVHVLTNDRERQTMRERPFSSGVRRAISPIRDISTVWDQLFKDCQPTRLQVDAAKDERIKRLKANKSLLDDLTGDLSRLRKELVGVEKIKLDSHEEAIRNAERAVANDLKVQESEEKPQQIIFDCKKPENLTSRDHRRLSQAHFDVMYAALKTERVGVAGMMHGYSSVQWDFEWLKFNPIIKDNVHTAIFHGGSSQRENFNKVANWKWTELAKFAEKLKNEPGGSLLDKVLIYATSHFGRHHTITRIPVVLIGNAQGKLQTGRSIKVKTNNDKPLTSVAHLCGVNIKGIGDDLNCGPLNVLHT